MMRALYSGVAGLKTHMTRLDVIGNNIANVNTYGFKSSRATFRDIYAQQIRGASAGTSTRGGINPSQIGYGTQLASVDLQMGQSAMTNTGNTLDLAITGDGFFQVQDPDGNIYYTKAGMMNIDTNGCVVDSNGNFVLGTTATSGQLDSTAPGSSIIKINVDPVEPARGMVEADLLGRKLRITAGEQNALGNVSFTFSSSNRKSTGEQFFAGEKVEVVMENGSDNITVRLNENELFKDISELQNAINDQIRVANGGSFPGGEFKFELLDSTGQKAITFAEINPTAGGLTGAELCSSREKTTYGSANPIRVSDTDPFWNGVNFVEQFGATFGADFASDPPPKIADANGIVATIGQNKDTPPKKTIKFTVNVTGTPKGAATGTTNVAYESDEIVLTDNVIANGASIKLYRKEGTNLLKDSTDSMGIKVSSTTCADIANGTITTPGTTPASPIEFTPSVTTNSIGLGKQTWTLSGGTEGGPQSYENLTGIAFNPDGTIIGSHAVHGRLVLGRIDLANFVNPQGLSQSGNSYYTPTANSGNANLAIPGEDGTGAIKSSSLEMSNVDLSQEFSDMIVTQRGYQANARIITVSDTMLEELVNLKR